MIAADDTRSRSAGDCIRWLECENLKADERAFWHYLGNKAQRYPVRFIPPFHKPKGVARVHNIIGAEIIRGNDRSGQPMARGFRLYSRGLQGSGIDVAHRGGADEFVSFALSKSLRSCYFVFRHGGRVELRLIAQQWAARFIELGYTVDVLMGGGTLKALIVKRGRHRWYLCCWAALSGLSPRLCSVFCSAGRSAAANAATDARCVWQASTRLQRLLLDYFGVGLSLTISNTGLRAAARSLPEFVCKFRPAPMLVALCREGAGFRGGLVKGRRYRGPSWLVDLNRAYTAALRLKLPWRAVIGPCVKDGAERHGIYMVRITGREGLPSIYVGRWNGVDVETAWHNDPHGETFLAIVPSVEFAGLRAIGYRVEPSFGMVYVRTFTLSDYVGKLVSFCQTFGWASAEAKVSKFLGNTVYGKFAAPPMRRDLRIGKTRPDRTWMVYVDERGYPVDDLWERRKVVYQWSQHIDVAADITGHVRAQVYQAQADMMAAGGSVYAMSTDALVLDRDPAGILDLDSSEPGKWRLSDDDEDGIVAGANAYSIGTKTIVPDFPGPTRDDVVALFTESYVVADIEKSGSPRPGLPLSWRVRRTITMANSDQYTTMVAGARPSADTALGP